MCFVGGLFSGIILQCLEYMPIYFIVMVFIISNAIVSYLVSQLSFEGEKLDKDKVAKNLKCCTTAY